VVQRREITDQLQSLRRHFDKGDNGLRRNPGKRIILKTAAIWLLLFPAALALPFLAILPLAPTFLLAGLFYLLNGMIGSVSGPVQSLFTMELVGQEERGTIEGVLHAMSELPMGMTSLIAGPLMLSNMWGTQFGWAAVLMLASTVLFFVFFRSVEQGAPKGG